MRERKIAELHEQIAGLQLQVDNLKAFHEAATSGAESFLAQTGYSDSRPHSSTAIARLMEDYAQLRAQALIAEKERLTDLVRYERHHLYDAGLLDDEEFAALVPTQTTANAWRALKDTIRRAKSSQS